MTTPEPIPAAWTLSDKSMTRLVGVHPQLVRVVLHAANLCPFPFVVIEGLRSRERQRMLVEKGASKTLNSRHLTGHAVDIAPLVDGKASWKWEHYYPLATAMKRAAAELGIIIEWGGDWQRFKDGPHWQLPR